MLVLRSLGTWAIRNYSPGSHNTKPNALSRLHSVDERCSELDSVRVLGHPEPGSPCRSGYWSSRSVVRSGCSSFGRSAVGSFVEAGLSSRDHPHPGFDAAPFLVAYHRPGHPVLRRRMCHLCTQQDIQQTSVWTASPAAYPQSSVVQHLLLISLPVSPHPEVTLPYSPL